MAVTTGSNVIAFSSALASGSYSLQVWDVNGVGIELTAQDANGFTVDALGNGVINYIAILNN